MRVSLKYTLQTSGLLAFVAQFELRLEPIFQVVPVLATVLKMELIGAQGNFFRRRFRALGIRCFGYLRLFHFFLAFHGIHLVFFDWRRKPIAYGSAEVSDRSACGMYSELQDTVYPRAARKQNCNEPKKMLHTQALAESARNGSYRRS